AQRLRLLIHDRAVALAEVAADVVRAADAEPEIGEQLKFLLLHRGVAQVGRVRRLPHGDVLLERDRDRIVERDWLARRRRWRLLRRQRAERARRQRGNEKIW